MKKFKMSTVGCLWNYVSPEEFEDIKKKSYGRQTPFLLINLEKIKYKYQELRENLPYAKIYYALKANPDIKVAKILHTLGSSFDVASVFELDQLLSIGVLPENISYGNTIKKESEIDYAYKKGVRLFATDSIDDLEKLARKAPESKVFFRILRKSLSADWPLSRKFGSHPKTLLPLIVKSKKMGLIPYGLSFHVGSQQRDITQWFYAIKAAKDLFDKAMEYGIELKLLNMGGGFPANYLEPSLPIQQYGRDITIYLKEIFKENIPQIIIEPGRSLVGDSGVIVCEVVMVSKKSKNNKTPWVFLDIGKFGGLIETTDEAIKFPIFTENSMNNTINQDVILAGPTCDSADILYEKFKYSLPKNTKAGDKVYIFTAGAYTQSYSSVNFNGFPPLAMDTKDDEKLIS